MQGLNGDGRGVVKALDQVMREALRSQLRQLFYLRLCLRARGAAAEIHLGNPAGCLRVHLHQTFLFSFGIAAKLILRVLPGLHGQTRQFLFRGGGVRGIRLWGLGDCDHMVDEP